MSPASRSRRCCSCPNGGPARKPAIVFADARGKAAAAAEAEQLAAQGYLVLAPDLRGFGETQPPLDRRDSFVRNFGDYENALTALLIGKTMAGMRAADVVGGVDLLAARRMSTRRAWPSVGRGGAAIPALLAALFDNRIKSVAVDGMLLSYEAVVNERIHQGIVEQIIPSALKYFDLPDVIAAIAPRRVAVFNGVNPLGQELTVGRLRQQYRRLRSRSPFAIVKNSPSCRFWSASSARNPSEQDAPARPGTRGVESRLMRGDWILWRIALLATLGCATALPQTNAVEFNRDIRPILSDRCYACHGPDQGKRMSKLRLDKEAGAKSDLGGHFAPAS